MIDNFIKRIYKEALEKDEAHIKINSSQESFETINKKINHKEYNNTRITFNDLKTKIAELDKKTKVKHKQYNSLSNQNNVSEKLVNNSNNNNIKDDLLKSSQPNVIKVKLNVLIKSFQEHNDLVTLLNSKNENEFKFSAETYIFLYEVYKSKIIEKAQIATEANKNKVKFKLTTKENRDTKEIKETIQTTTENDNVKDIIKAKRVEKATSTFLDNCKIQYSQFTNNFGQSSIKTCRVFYKTLTESSYINKAITAMIKQNIMNRFIFKQIEIEEFLNNIAIDKYSKLDKSKN